MTKQYRSETMAAIHETAEGLHSIGLMEKQTMRQFDDACLTPVRPLSAADIRALRKREGACQAVFARYLNVTTGLIANGSGGKSTRKAHPSSCCRSWRKTGWAAWPEHSHFLPLNHPG